MVWARIDDRANSNAKLMALSDAAFRMWVGGLVFCQMNQTEGFIPDHALGSFGVRAKNNKGQITAELCAPVLAGRRSLWHRVPAGYQVNDYLEWNDSRTQVQQARQTGKQRKALFLDPALRALIRARDGDQCRYCGETCIWTDRKGPLGGTYDHVWPYAGNGLENLVVSCRGCNSRKRGRTPDEAVMALLPPTSRLSRSESRSDPGEKPRFDQATTTTPFELSKDQKVQSAPTAQLLQRFDERHQERFGAKASFKPGKDGKLIAALWRERVDDPVSVEALIDAFFLSRDPFIAQAGYSIGVLVSQAPKLVGVVARRVIQTAPAESWREQCNRLHEGRCGNPGFHDAKMAEASAE